MTWTALFAQHKAIDLWFLFLQLTVVRQRDKLEPWLKHYLVEDKGFHAQQMSYVDFLCHIHKEIRNLLN